MNKLLMIYGCVLLSSSAVAKDQQSTAAVVDEKTEHLNTFENSFTVLNLSAELDEATFGFYGIPNKGPYELNLNEIEFLEEDLNVDLGFDTSDYLPSDFNPYENYFDLNSLIYIENETEFPLDFDTSKYVPEGFDPYSDVVDIHSVNYMEDEDLDLGFNTMDYLPEGFSPYEVYVDLSAIQYIETDVEWEFGEGFKHILPEGFDPYTEVLEVSSINYVEEDEIDMGFDTVTYLPENFDPYARVD